MINRKKQPKIFDIAPDRGVVELIAPKTYLLDNGIKVFTINAGTQDLCRLEFIFDAGTWYQKGAFVAMSANDLMKEGSFNMTARQIADELDFYGAYHEASTEKDSAYQALYSLNKHLPATLKVMEEIIKKPKYDQQEVDIYLKKKHQGLLVNMEKVNYLARIHFGELLYGSTHPYGRWASPADVQGVSRDEIIAFHKTYYRSSNCYIIASGMIGDEVIDLLNQYFGGDDWSGPAIINNTKFEEKAVTELIRTVEKPDALQTALRVGKVLFNRTHNDFAGMHVLNTILGGYFGSRLMTNIREDKGYTYGIGSGLISLKHSGFFYISSEVGNAFADRAMDEIFNEINLLRNEPVSNEELSLVRNYLGGTFLRSVDGAFSLAERFKEMHEHDLTIDYYFNLLDKIQTITSDEIMELANRYLSVDSLYQLKVGK
ncbi:MAG: insulinase family protein [Bacteroidetes bacterium]|nr:insulinase family protein [Bacteroidota bacterium]